MCGANTGERVGNIRKQKRRVRRRKAKTHGESGDTPRSGNEGDVYTRRKRGLQEDEEDELVLMVSLVLFCILQCFVVLFFS